VGEPLWIVDRSSVIDACFELEDTFCKVHDVVETPLEGSRHVLMHKESPSLGFDDCVFFNPLYHTHVSLMYSQTSPSPGYSLDAPIDNPKIVILMLTWAMRIISLVCLVRMFMIMYP